MDKPKKVYVITKGVYSDYHICAVTSNKKTAEILRKTYSENSWDDAKIEEWDLNGDPEEIRIMFRVVFGNIETTCEFDEYENREAIYCPKGSGVITVYVRAKDKESAIKIAAERKAEYLARKEGIE